MKIQEFTFLFISVLSSVAGQLFLKSGALKLGQVSINNGIHLITNIIKIPELLAGLTCYALGALSYIILLSKVHLSIAGPSVSLVYVFSVLLGYFIFKEPIPLTRLTGLGFVVCGVILIIWQK